MELQTQDNKTVQAINSVEVAQMVDKDHSKLLRDIRQYSEYLAEAKIGLGEFFVESTYEDNNNQERPCYLVTKKGCDMVANKLTGKKGTIFTARYVTRFNQMEQSLLEGLSPEMQALLIHDNKIVQHDKRIENLEETKFINPNQKKKIVKKVKELVVKACGTETPAYKSLSRKVFSECWNYLFDEFKVSQVAEIPFIKAEAALEYVNAWYPKPKTAQRIKQLNECV